MGAFTVLLLLLLPGAAGGAAVCGYCPGPLRNASVVARYCASRAGTESEGRCCRERGARPERLLGDLTENPLRALPDGSFLGFTHLRCLAVPPALECPGGSSAWEEVTTRGGSRLCQGQRNPCNGSGELAWLCPENAACAPDGPGLVACLCESPFHGYKCLREGAFPGPLFCGILGTVTLALALLLWGTQRRKAKSP
ncbi:all-trans retinoic acid-induced differentiation factor isoform X2 [Nyctibius grandis]|uniref:all-trans retinoic acid-induced differentiation factor isoform X2 n=1 Tax=Nyctibius grandis TaxID=48427 RepID=UPI0035BBB84E